MDSDSPPPPPPPPYPPTEGLDTVVSSVILKFTERARAGKEKYGKTLDRTDLSVLDWIKHAQEEHMDAILYLEKLKQILVGR